MPLTGPRTKRLALFGILALALFAGWLMSGGRLPGEPDAVTAPRKAPSSASHGTDSTAAPAVESRPPTNHPPAQPGAAINAIQPNTLSLADFKSLENPELEALSPEEAAWLRRHGFPTAEEVARVATMDRDALWGRGNSGDLVAMALLGHKFLSEGDMGMAAAAFGQAATQGSVYAREQSAITEKMRDGEYGNYVGWEGFAIDMEVARVYGDHRVDMLIQRYMPPGAYNDMIRASVLASLPFALQGLAEDARLRGVPPVTPEPRPNADIWQAIDSGTAAEVAVYPRDGLGKP